MSRRSRTGLSADSRPPARDLLPCWVGDLSRRLAGTRRAIQMAIRQDRRRRELAALDNHQRHDVGLTRTGVRHECANPGIARRNAASTSRRSP